MRVEHCFHTKEKGFTSQVVHLDLAGPLPESKEGHKYILGLVDHFSAFVMVIAIKGKTHKEVMEAFINNWIYRIGPPEVLVSDNEFVSQEVQRMCRVFNIRHDPTLTYNPRSNGQIERQFWTIKQLLRAATRGLAQETWTKWIGAVTFAINANVNRSTGFTPFYLMFGREPNIPLHTIVGLPVPEALEPQYFVRTGMLAMQEVCCGSGRTTMYIID